MNICIVNPGFQMGGAEKITTELANFLSVKNNVTVVDFNGTNKYYYQLEPNINTDFTIPKLPFKRKVIRKLGNLQYKFTQKDINPVIVYKEQANKLVKVFKLGNFDLVVLSQGLLTSLIPYIKSKLPYLKIIAWQHNSYDIYVNKYYKNILKYFLSGVKQADSIVCLTQQDAESFKKLNPSSTCIYNSLTLENPIISNLTSKNILFAGRLVIEQKGLDYLVELAKRIDDEWKILIAGDGIDKENIKKMILESSLEEKVILYGNLKSEELKSFYSKGSIFVSTSRWEGFGLVITEAMASGLPIISFDNFGPNEILSKGEFGILIDKYDLKTFSEQLLLLANSIEERMYWKNKSLERSKDFQRENIMKLWEQHIKFIFENKEIK